MEATKDHISLETAKLLKDCGVESEYMYVTMDTFSKTENMPLPIIVKRKELVKRFMCWYRIDLSPRKEESKNYEVHYSAFTWGEILWEHAEEFFGEEYSSENIRHVAGLCDNITETIFNHLQIKEYEQADLYFRENCILINKK